ncbi:MAG: hypothetical protein Q8J78_15865 [Moraxellaceae bacterium]|nr:hypothetical protein [Moraxellaceae bacterium]
MKYKAIATLALVLTTTSLTFATGSVSIPKLFSAGQAAKASDVNENFQALADAINVAALRLDPFSRPDDFTTTAVAGLTEGSTHVFGGVSHTIVRMDGISFKDGDSSTYEVYVPASANGSQLALRNAPYVASDIGDIARKTTVGGHPAAILIYMSNSDGVGMCSADIALNVDSGAVFVGGEVLAPLSLSSPLTKSDQQACKEYWKQLLRHIAVTKVS